MRKPEVWDALSQQLNRSNDSAVRERVRDLSVVFGDGRALDEVKKVALDTAAHLTARKTALQTLIDQNTPDLRQVCEQLLSVRFLNPVAARGLAKFDDPIIAAKLVRAYQQFHPSDRPQLLATLVSRPVFAFELLDAVAERRLSRAELSPFHARQIRSLNDANLNQKLNEIWGELRDSDGDRQQLISRWKRQAHSRSSGQSGQEPRPVVVEYRLCFLSHAVRRRRKNGAASRSKSTLGKLGLSAIRRVLLQCSGVTNASRETWERSGV